MGLLPFVLGLLIRFVPAMRGLAGPNGNVSAQELLQILVTCACLAGTASSVRELVKERPIYIRELAAGLSSAPSSGQRTRPVRGDSSRQISVRLCQASAAARPQLIGQ